MARNTVKCNACGVEIDADAANFDIGSEQYLCADHFRQRQLADARRERDELAAWLETTHLQKLRELDRLIAKLDTPNAQASPDGCLTQEAPQGEIIQRCSTCGDWGREDDIYDIPSIPNGIRRCLHPSVGGGSYSDVNHERPDAASSYECIGTGPEFCCIHWKLNAPAQWCKRSEHPTGGDISHEFLE